MVYPNWIFFHTAADELPFHKQYGNLDKSAYLELPLCFDPKMSSMPWFIIMKNTN